MKRHCLKTIEHLPNELLLEIFEYLSPRDLSYCSLVSKRWYSLTSNNEIWKKVFRKYHINLPLRNEISSKKEYLRRSKSYMIEFVSKHIKSRRINHLFPSYDDTRKLELSVIGELTDKKKNKLLLHIQRIDPIRPSSGIGICLNYQKKIDMGKFPRLEDIDSINLILLVPALIKKLIPAKDTIRIHLQMYSVPLSKKLDAINNRDCQCEEIFNKKYPTKSAHVIEWHFCVNHFLIGLWSNDKSLAYFSHHISIVEVQSIMEKFLCNSSTEKTKLPSFVNSAGSNPSNFSLNTSETDLKCRLSLENIEPCQSLLLNCWRSVGYSKGLSTVILEKSDSVSHLKFNSDIEFKPAIGHLHFKCQNLIKVEVHLLNSRNDPLWSHSSCVVLLSNSISNVDYNYANTELAFDDSVVKGTIIKKESGEMYLTEFVIL